MEREVTVLKAEIGYTDAAGFHHMQDGLEIVTDNQDEDHNSIGSPDEIANAIAEVLSQCDLWGGDTGFRLDDRGLDLTVEIVLKISKHLPKNIHAIYTKYNGWWGCKIVDGDTNVRLQEHGDTDFEKLQDIVAQNLIAMKDRFPEATIRTFVEQTS